MDQNNAFFYFAEQTSPEPSDNKISFDVQKGSGNTWWVEFDSCLHVFEFMNRNTRQYLGDNIMECLSMDKIQSQLANNAWYGEMDHPYPKKKGEELSEKRIRTIELDRRSHKIMNPRREGNKLFAHIQTASGTEAGRGFAKEIIQGLIPTFSCRCFGVMRLINGKPTIMVRMVVTYDWVLYPGFGDAKISSKPTTSTASIPYTEDSDGITLFESSDISIPFEELALDIASKDGGIAAYMESFGDDSKIIGVTGNKAIISPDSDHFIYINMNKNSVDRVRDFYRSFNI